MDKSKALYMASLFSLTLLPLTCAHAGGPDHYRGASAGMWRGMSPYMSLMGGVGWSTSGKQSDVTLSIPLVVNRYEASNAFRAAPVLGLGAGVMWSHVGGHNVDVSLGLESGYSRVLSASGEIFPLYNLSPSYDRLGFRYAVSSVPLLMLSNISFVHGSWMPYVLWGIGMSWNRTSRYNEFPENPESSATPMRSAFAPRTVYDFAYTVGAGLGYALSVRTKLSVEYRYTDYGRAELNPSGIQSTMNRLSLGSVSSHAVLVKLSESFS